MKSCDVEEALDISLKNLGLDYVDMYLIHLPFGTEKTADYKPLKDENGVYVLDYSTNHHDIWRVSELLQRSIFLRSDCANRFNFP